MADYGIKVSQSGYSVYETDETKFILKTNSNLLKVKSSGGGTISSSGGAFTSISHDLGYVPQYLAYIESTTVAGRMNLATATYIRGLAKSDTSNLKLQEPSLGSVSNVDYYYYIFYEPADSGSAPTVTSTNDYGIRISKDGFDVKTANILQQTFNSEKNCLKISAEGTSSYTGTGGSITIAHGLGYIPAWLLWFEVDGSGKWFGQYMNEHLSGKGVNVIPYTDGTNLVAEINMASSATVKIYYVLFVDPVQ